MTTQLASFNITWDSPSRDSLDAMPLSGRFGAGANVWVQDESIWLYPGHSGAHDEKGRPLKLGCIRITPVGINLGGEGFRQELDLATGTISIRQDDFNALLWFAGETLVVEIHAARQPRALDVAYATWRDHVKEGVKLDLWGIETVQPDRVLADAEGFVWWHRNADYPFDVTALSESQGIPATAVRDRISNRVFGGALVVRDGLSTPVASRVRWQCWEGTAWTGRTPARVRHLLTIALRAHCDAEPLAWRNEAASIDVPKARKEEADRWAEFWSRSHIIINPGGGDRDPGWLIGRNYQLFRTMLACNRDGEFPLLFNGGIFTTDNIPGRITGNNADELTLELPPDAICTPDFRRWLMCRFMAQNQRWIGWPTLAAGDADLLEPSLAFYRDGVEVAAARARRQGADGVVYPEPIDVWGLCPVKPRPDGLCGMTHLTYHFSMMLEHAWMALQGRDALGVSIEQDLPWIVGSVLFYDSFYRSKTRERTGRELGDDGKLILYPANALEFGAGAKNPIEVIAGLCRVTEGLLALPDLSPATRARISDIRARLPGLPVGMREGRQSLLPAEKIEEEFNKWEFGEMYAAWPYRLVGIVKPETIQLARDTWASAPEYRARCCKQDLSWTANLCNVAALAWPDEAKKRAIYKLANIEAPQARFPAFFGPGLDWLPDHNWGGSGSTGLQEMLLAPEPGPHGKLNLFAGWPPEWDVEFKLHAPGSTVVECVYRAGRIERIEVTPASRTGDVVNWLGKTPA